MRISVSNLLNKLSFKKRGRERYYSLVELSEFIKEEKMDNVFVDSEYLLTPFYLDDQGGTYELYQYELTIRLENEPKFDKILAEQIEKSPLMKPEDVTQRMKKLYIEIMKYDATLPVARLIEYLNYISLSDEIREDVISTFSRYNRDFEFNEKDLYFAVY